MKDKSKNTRRPMWEYTNAGVTERERRHAQLVRDVETHLPYMVTNTKTVTDPELRTKLEVPDAVAIPPALSLAISQAGLEILVAESGTQGVGGGMVVVVR